ncbi:MAG: flavin reductase domain protein [Verrucomicrobiaceae bacterium]|nr:flavin reductase domain protein [Verrucomicrobiaceae bacterium]
MSTIDPIQLRNAFGTFITGVTIVTCRDPHGKPVGMTANSFSSVSLDPPLALWSIAKTATNFEAFHTGTHFAIHILHSGQEQISRHFATKNIDKFLDVPFDIGAGDTPLLQDYSARFECEVEHRYLGGDHIILVGRILAFDNLDKEPLVFFKGQYKQLVK